MLALLLTPASWETLFADGLGGVTGVGMMVLALACWSVSYFYACIRGTRA